MKIRSPLLIRLAAHAITGGCRLLFKTLRIEVIQETSGTSPYGDTGGERFIFCIWHDSILGPTFGGPQDQVAALTSQHTDGTLVADVLSCVGITPIRGSSSRGGSQAVKQLMEAARDHHIVIATDGPRGPRQEVKAGIVYLAAQTGRAIIPVTFDATSTWRPMGKWTDLIVPKPFSTATLLTGPPIRVPQKLTKDERTLWTEIVQSEMDRLNANVARVATGESIENPTADRLAA